MSGKKLKIKIEPRKLLQKDYCLVEEIDIS